MKHPLIIDRPDLQAWEHKALFGALTAAFWVLWVFLWLPLVTLLGWLFFGYQFQFHMINLAGYQGFLDLLKIYALIILFMNGALIAWAKYNHLRFRGVDRRKEAAPTSLQELATLQGQTVQTILYWQSCQVMTVQHDSQGVIETVEPHLPPTATPGPPALRPPASVSPAPSTPHAPASAQSAHPSPDPQSLGPDFQWAHRPAANSAGESRPAQSPRAATALH